MNIPSIDQPENFPTKQVNGAPLKTITQVLLERRATQHFKPDPVPQEYLDAILRFAGQAPSGYNLQPWRFIVVREEENRRRLQQAAFNQPKVSEAPVVVITFAIPGDPQKYMDTIMQEGVRRHVGKAEEIENVKKRASDFLKTIPPPVWLSRHTMIGFTTMMLVAESYGLDTAPMEGFDPQAVKTMARLPSDAEVIALLAIGFAKEPDKAYGGRWPLPEIVNYESYRSPGKKS